MDLRSGPAPRRTAGIDCLVTRSAIPAKTALRSACRRPECAALAKTPCWRNQACSPIGPRRSRFAAAPRSGPLPLRPRSRHDDHPVGPRSPGRCRGAPHRRRACRQGSPGRDPRSARQPDRGQTQTRWPQTRRPRADSRRRGTAGRCGNKIGVVTSGFGPTVNGPVIMAYVDAAHRRRHKINAMLRGTPDAGDRGCHAVCAAWVQNAERQDERPMTA